MRKFPIILTFLVVGYFVARFFSDGGKVTCSSPSGEQMGLNEAMRLAKTYCVDGKIEEQAHYCNLETGTWWFDYSLPEKKEGCDTACVVYVDSGEAKIDWDCK